MGNSNFNENTRVQVPAALHLCKLGYTYLDNINAYDTKTNILIDVFLNAVKRLNPSMTSQEASLLFSKIVNIANNDDLGRELYQMLSSNNGIKLAHPTFRVMRQSCSAYSLSLKYLSSLKPYALRFITFILLFSPSTLAVEI